MDSSAAEFWELEYNLHPNMAFPIVIFIPVEVAHLLKSPVRMHYPGSSDDVHIDQKYSMVLYKSGCATQATDCTSIIPHGTT